MVFLPMVLSAAVCAPPAVAAAPVKVFIMVGQSNMVGHGYFEAKNATTGQWRNGTLGYLAQDPRTKAEYEKLIDKANGKWARREDVFIINDVNALGNASANPPPAEVQTGNIGAFLGPGWGGEATSIGPELGFGWAVGDALAPPVLLLKVAWGGKTLGTDFRPPSSGGTVGPYYTWMVRKVRKYLGSLDKYLPSVKGASSSYVLSGFVWHQGWNDGCDLPLAKEYATNMPNLIRDIRKEFSDLPQDKAHPKLPFSIGASGMGGWAANKSAMDQYVIPAQLAVGNATLFPEFAGNVLSAETRDFFRPQKFSPGWQVYHWYNNAESYWLLGKVMAKNMLTLLGPLPPRPAPAPPAPPSPPTPAGTDMVIIYQQGGNGTLRLGPSNFSKTKGMPGRGWDACPGPNGAANFSNGASTWPSSGMGEMQVQGNWVVRTIGQCCFKYHYSNCNSSFSEGYTAADGVVNLGQATIFVFEQ